MSTKRTRPRRVKAGAVILPRILSFPSDTPTKPFWYLPRTAAAYDAMLVQGSVALYKTEGKRISRDEVIAAVLRSFGITRPRD